MPKSDKKRTIKFSLYLDEAILTVLKRICETSGSSVNSLIKSMIFDYLSDNNYIQGLEIKKELYINESQ